MYSPLIQDVWFIRSDTPKVNITMLYQVNTLQNIAKARELDERRQRLNDRLQSLNDRHTGWYKQLRSHMHAVDGKEREARIQSPDGIEDKPGSNAYRAAYDKLIDRIDRRRSIFERFCAYNDECYERSYREFEQLCTEYYLPHSLPQSNPPEYLDDIITLAFLMIDCPEQHRIRFLSELKLCEGRVVKDVIDNITNIQMACSSTLEMFCTVATSDFMEFLGIYGCTYCGTRFRVGEDMRWAAGERGSFHNSCLKKWRESNGRAYWTPVGTACREKIAKCVKCSKDFELGDEVIWSQCQRHAFHLDCHKKFEAIYPILPWRPIMCPCLPKPS